MVWNSNSTDSQQAISAEVITFAGGNGDQIHAYVARPGGTGPYPGIVLIHHLPGWDELYQEFARRFANHGYTVISPDLYCREGHGTPDDVAAKVRADGGVTDAQVAADCEAAMNWLRAQPTATARSGSSEAAPAAGTPSWSSRRSRASTRRSTSGAAGSSWSRPRSSRRPRST